MYRCLLIIVGSLLFGIVKAQTERKNMLVKNRSELDFGQTVARIQTTLKKMEIPVFAVFDHAKNAEEVGLVLAPTQVIVFGSPKVGTLLMQKHPELSIELPLKIAVWEEGSGEVWVAFPDMKQMAEAYTLSGDPIMEKMAVLLESIVDKSIHP